MPKNPPIKFTMKKERNIKIRPIIEYLTLSRPWANFCLSPPDVIIFIAPLIIKYAEKKIPTISANSISTPIILDNVSNPPVGTPGGNPVGEAGFGESILLKPGNDNAIFINMNQEL